MEVCAIVAEYNPLHNGHLYHIAQTRKAGARHIVAILSGNFVQRAEPAILDKFRRAAAAVQCGVDLVVELPVQYATASSERFAFGALFIAEALGCVDALAFGSECGDIATLERAADAVLNSAVTLRTKQLCESGEPYPAARRMAVCEQYGEALAAVLDSPNNLLGVDYLKALRTLNSSIQPFTISRAGAAHDSSISDSGFASASHVRALITTGHSILDFAPPETQRFVAQGTLSGGLWAAERAVLYKLRGMTREQFAVLPGCADGLGDRLFAASASATGLAQLYDTAKTKRYTMSRVRRAVCAAILGLDERYYFSPPYIRILAIGPGGKDLLREIKQRATLPVSHSLRQLADLGGSCKVTAEAEARATDFFYLTTPVIAPTGADYTAKLVVWPKRTE